jgi:hypothetical protein
MAHELRRERQHRRRQDRGAQVLLFVRRRPVAFSGASGQSGPADRHVDRMKTTVARGVGGRHGQHVVAARVAQRALQTGDRILVSGGRPAGRAFGERLQRFPQPGLFDGVARGAVGGRRRILEWFDRIDRHVRPIGGHDDGVEIRQQRVSAPPSRSRKGFGDDDQRLAGRAESSEMGGEGVEGGRGNLGAAALDLPGRAGDEVALEGAARHQVAPPRLEGLDGLDGGAAIAGEPDLQQRLERLQDDHQIVRPQILVDEPDQRVAHPFGARASRDVELVQEDGDQPSRVGDVPLLRRRGSHHGDCCRGAGRAHETHGIDCERARLFGDRKIRGPEGLDRMAAAVFDDDVECGRSRGRARWRHTGAESQRARENQPHRVSS